MNLKRVRWGLIECKRCDCKIFLNENVLDMIGIDDEEVVFEATCSNCGYLFHLYYKLDAID